jgi:hypothetical protein
MPPHDRVKNVPATRLLETRFKHEIAFVNFVPRAFRHIFSFEKHAVI